MATKTAAKRKPEDEIVEIDEDADAGGAGYAGPTCKSCPLFVYGKNAAEVKRIYTATGVEPRGECRLHPTVARKLPTDGCGQHPEALAASHLLAFGPVADRFAAALAAALKAKS